MQSHERYDSRMRTVLALTVLSPLIALPALAQATSEWSASNHVPVAVVEVAGGDLEVAVAALPPEASPPTTVAGFAATLTPERGILVWSVRVPALLVHPVLEEFLRPLAGIGCAAVVLLGPVPAREMREELNALDAVPLRAPPRLPCVLADGGVEVVRGAPERVELSFAVPGPQDPRYDLLPALAAFLRMRLHEAFPDVRIDSELHGGCASLHLEVPAGREGARSLLARIRRHLATELAVTPTADEVAKAAAASDALASQAAVDGRAVAEELVQRLALGGTLAGALAAPALDAATLGGLARQVLGGHAGSATLVEQERRPLNEATTTLDDGAVLAVSWIPSSTGVLAVALGGVDPRGGHALLAAAADHAARQGWNAVVEDVLGVPTLAAVAPAAAVVAMLEQVSDALAAPPPSPPADLVTDVVTAEGLAEHVSGESVSIALALPPELDEGPEAGRKFFGGLPTAGVRTGAPLPGAGLAWTVRDGDPEVIGVADVPASVAGLVAAQIVQDRLSGETDVRTFLLAPPGRVVLAVDAQGGAHVPAVDARLAGLWNAARRACTAGELTRITHRMLATLYGGAAQATARAAASAFVPHLPSAERLLATEPSDVDAALHGLPSWEQLARFARGRGPDVVVPPTRRRGVRKSPPRR
jgi:hypothetical protein